MYEAKGLASDDEPASDMSPEARRLAEREMRKRDLERMRGTAGRGMERLFEYDEADEDEYEPSRRRRRRMLTKEGDEEAGEDEDEPIDQEVGRGPVLI